MAQVRLSRLKFFINKKHNRSSPEQQHSAASAASSSATSHINLEPPTKRRMPEAMTPSTQTHLIIRFYDQNIQAKDSHGRTQKDMLSWSGKQLELNHNYIQMLFPLPEGSPYNWSAPVVTREVFDAFRSRSELRDSMQLSFERMLEFYGFAISREPKPNAQSKQEDSEKSSGSNTETSPEDNSSLPTESKATTASSSKFSSATYSIIRGPKWRKKTTNWCIRFDHNHLRITRILRCLRVMGLQTECNAFYEALQEVFADPTVSIGDRSMMYWTRAVQRPLHQAPDDDHCDWLEAWEEEQQNTTGREGE